MSNPELWNHETFIAKLQEVGKNRYHHLHPFHVRMHQGELTREAIQIWVLNRFYYQRNLPPKDAAILSNCPLREVRRVWLHRITDHDGDAEKEGGIEAWLRLAEACGLDRQRVLDGEEVLPGVRFAVDAYVTFCRTQPWPVAIASSLTELFAPDIMKTRLEAFAQHYTWVPNWGFDYFKSRVTRARLDSEEGIELTLKYCATPELQRAALNALKLKCDLLWSMLDAIQNAAYPRT
jgi:pyrroloquinoline-quinone synthase